MEIPGKARAVALVLGLGLSPLPIIGAAPVAAQDAQPPSFSVSIAPVVLAEPEVDTPFEISVGPEAQLPKQSYVRVRGLPLAARLSDGHVISLGSWAIPLSALRSLKVKAPISASGRTEITVSVLNIDGTVLAEAKSSLVVAPAWLLGSANRGKEAPKSSPPSRSEPKPAGETAAPVASAPAAPPTAPVAVAAAAAPSLPPPAPAAPAPAAVASLPPPAPPALPQVVLRTPAAPPPAAAPAPVRMLTPAEAERAGRLLFQGDNYRNQGNIAAARQFYRRAADMGLALAAVRLGATYDAVDLAQLNVHGGIDPDPAEARKWYERAKELGSPDAEARISRLPPKR